MQKNEKEAKSEADWPLVDQEPGPGSLELQIADIFVSDAKNYRWWRFKPWLVLCCNQPSAIWYPYMYRINGILLYQKVVSNSALFRTTRRAQDNERVEHTEQKTFDC